MRNFTQSLHFYAFFFTMGVYIMSNVKYKTKGD